MTKYANYTGTVTPEGSTKTSAIREGDLYEDDDALVKAMPHLFTDTEPNSQVAGAFPMEGTVRNSDLGGDVVEEKRWEGERPPGFETSDADRSPTAADELREEGEPAEKEKPAKRASAPRVERATRAPGEKR